MSGYSTVEVALAEISRMSQKSLEEYQEVCEQVLGLLEAQRVDPMGNIYAPKDSILRVLRTSRVLVTALLGIKTTMVVQEPASEQETVKACMEFVMGGNNRYKAGDVVYFLPKCGIFNDIPPEVPFVIVDPNASTSSHADDLSFDKAFAIEVAFLDKQETVRTAFIDKRRVSKNRHKMSNIVDTPSTELVS